MAERAAYEVDAVVIGAGLAGLVAARHLGLVICSFSRRFGPRAE